MQPRCFSQTIQSIKILLSVHRIASSEVDNQPRTVGKEITVTPRIRINMQRRLVEFESHKLSNFEDTTNTGAGHVLQLEDSVLREKVMTMEFELIVGDGDRQNGVQLHGIFADLVDAIQGFEFCILGQCADLCNLGYCC